MNKLNCIILDDNEIDRLTVLSLVKKNPAFNIIGTFENATEAFLALEDQKIDVLFLDIDMPEMNGFEFRKKMDNVPVCIFITAHPEHAVESFNVETLDFIVKPIRTERFSQTVDRIIEFMALKNKANLYEASFGSDTITIKEGHEQSKIKLTDIIYLEGLKDYTLIFTSQKRHCVLQSIGNLLKDDHFKSFVRTHRSFAVQKQFIKTIKPQEILLNNDVTIPIGRSFKENLKELL
ncbi:MAG: response regulator transcription factor [Bacteroidetes bacterium]|nr:response regulator transcription factor [Bacteroidota bacterium]